MDLTLWSWLIISSKIIIYFGICAVVGGIPWILSSSVHQFKRQIARDSILIIGFAMFALLLNFLLQVGAFAEAGIGGMFDLIILQIIADSGVGSSTMLRLAGFTLALLMGIACYKNLWQEKKYQFFWVASTLVAILLVLFSFRWVGHLAEKSWLLQTLLILHVATVAWWMGALLPLVLACYRIDNKNLYLLMHRFGQVASLVVGILIVAGGVLAWQLVGTLESLLMSGYGRVLMVKLLLVGVILLFAIRHKLRLVPGLIATVDEPRNVEQHKNAMKLAKSIRFEIFVGVSILVVTSVLTSAMGPAH